jgi:hypothetical protein
MAMQSVRTVISIALACAGLLTLRAATSRAQDESADPRPSIKDLAWIAGDWRSEDGDNHLQEHWDAPLGDSMMGMFRWVRGDRLWITEHITIVDDGDKIVYRFRHFGRGLDAWEDKKDPITFDLLSLSDGRAVFENPDPSRGRPKRILYLRDGDTLTVRLEGENRESPDIFVFKLNR